LLESFRSKQVEGKPLIKAGDVVILKNDQTKRAFWKLSRIIECFTGKDGNIRGAKVEVASSRDSNLGKRIIQIHVTIIDAALHNKYIKCVNNGLAKMALEYFET